MYRFIKNRIKCNFFRHELVYIRIKVLESVTSIAVWAFSSVALYIHLHCKHSFLLQCNSVSKGEGGFSHNDI